MLESAAHHPSKIIYLYPVTPILDSIKNGL